MPFFAYKGTDKAILCVFTVSEGMATEDPTVWPKPALQSNTNYNCIGIQEREGASTPAIHCRHSPRLQTWEKLRMWARELLLTLLQHSEKHFVKPFMRHLSTTYTALSPWATGSCCPCSSGCFKSFTAPSLSQQSAMSQAEPSGFSWKPWCQCRHWQTSQQHDCIRRVEDTCLQNNWQRPKHHWVRVFNKIWHDTHAISCASPACGPYFSGHISPSCWQDKHLSISPVIFPMLPVGYTRPVPALLYSALLLLSAFPIKYLV